MYYNCSFITDLITDPLFLVIINSHKKVVENVNIKYSILNSWSLLGLQMIPSF